MQWLRYPGAQGRHLRQGPQRARRDLGRRRDVLRARERDVARWPSSRSPTSTSGRSASGRRSSSSTCSRRSASPRRPEIKARVAEALASLAAAPARSPHLERPGRSCSALSSGAVLSALHDRSEAAASARSSTPTTTSSRDASWLHFEMGHLMSLGEEAIVPALDYLFHRVEQGFDGSPDAHDPRRGVAVSAPPDLHAPTAGLAQDAAQEERLRRLRDPGGRGRGRQPDSPDDPQRLPHEDLPARTRRR